MYTEETNYLIQSELLIFGSGILYFRQALRGSESEQPCKVQKNPFIIVYQLRNSKVMINEMTSDKFMCCRGSQNHLQLLLVLLHYSGGEFYKAKLLFSLKQSRYLFGSLGSNSRKSFIKSVDKSFEKSFWKSVGKSVRKLIRKASRKSVQKSFQKSAWKLFKNLFGILLGNPLENLLGNLLGNLWENPLENMFEEKISQNVNPFRRKCENEQKYFFLTLLLNFFSPKVCKTKASTPNNLNPQFFKANPQLGKN